MGELKFISCENLINRVLEKLRSYKSSGHLDEGMFYRWLKEELNFLNIPGYSSVKLITKLDGDTLLKPDDYKTLWTIWKIDPCKDNTPRRRHLQKHDVAAVYKTRCQEAYVTECENIIFEGDFIETKYYLETGGEIITDCFCNRRPLRVFSDVNYSCDYDRKFNYVDSPYQVREDKHRFHFNFKDEFIFIEYFAFLIDEDGLPMVPDEPVIERSLEAYITYKFFEDLYLNNSIDALQRMQYSEMKYKEGHDRAVDWLKTPSFQQMLKNAERISNKYLVFDHPPLSHSRPFYGRV